MRQRILNMALLFSLSVIASPSQRAPAQEGRLTGLDDYFERAIQEWDVPGIAVVVVKDDEVLLAKGYGVRKLGDDTPVDEHTLFAIGSCSKAFTAAALAMLVEEEKIEWDDKVTEHLADFELFDPYVTREITVRDLLCHRSGLSRGDRLWYGMPYNRDEVLRRVRFLEPSWSFRSRYGYQNIMFLAAGEIIPAVTGKSWDQFVDERILSPLAMDTSTTSVVDLESHGNVAAPHREVDGELRPIRYRNLDNIAPAGSINSCVREMAQWIRFQLGEGEIDGNRLLAAKSIAEMHTPHSLIAIDEQTRKLFPSMHFSAYGLAWSLRDYRGRMIISHGGGIDGMISYVALVPEESLGVMVLSNRDGQNLPAALTFKVLDRFLGSAEPDRDWATVMLALRDQQQQQIEEAQKKREDERVAGTSPSLELIQYAGDYESELYGPIKVTHQNDALVLQFGPNFIGDMEHWHHDTFRVKWRYEADPAVYVTFNLDAAGEASEIDYEGDATFERREEGREGAEEDE